MEFKGPPDKSPAPLVPQSLLPASPHAGSSALRDPRGLNKSKPKETNIMLMTIAVILIVLWLLGLVTSVTMGGLIHVLLVVAVIVVLVRLIQGRKVV